MSKTPKKKPTTKTGVMAALHPEPKATAAGQPGAKAGPKGASGRKG